MDLQQHINAQMKKAQLLGRLNNNGAMEDITIAVFEGDEPRHTIHSCSIAIVMEELEHLDARGFDAEIILNNHPTTRRDLRRIQYYLAQPASPEAARCTKY